MSVVPNFEQRVRQVIGIGIQSQFPELVRRSIQVAAVIGGKNELDAIDKLKESELSEVASDARACIFYVKHER